MHSRSSRRASTIHRSRERSSSGSSPTSGSPTTAPSGARTRAGAAPPQCCGASKPLELLWVGCREDRGWSTELDSRKMVPSAYLRLFQPLDRFERDEQLHWERYLLHPPISVGPGRFADRETAAGLGLLAPAGTEEAEVRVIN